MSWIEVIPSRWARRAIVPRPAYTASSEGSIRSQNARNASSLSTPAGRPAGSTSKPRIPRNGSAASSAFELREPMCRSLRIATTRRSVATRSRSSRSRYRRSGHPDSSHPIPTTHASPGLRTAEDRRMPRASSRLLAPSRTAQPISPAASAMWAWASTKPGTTTRPQRSRTRVRGPAQASACRDVPTATTRSPRTARARAHGRSRDDVNTRPSTRTRSASPAIEGGMPGRGKDLTALGAGRHPHA